MRTNTFCVNEQGMLWPLGAHTTCKSTQNLPHGYPWQLRAARTDNNCPQTPASMHSFPFFFRQLVFLRVIIALPCEPRNSLCDGESLRLKRRELEDLSGRCQGLRGTPLVRSGAQGNMLGSYRCKATTGGKGAFPWMRSLTDGIHIETGWKPRDPR